MNMQRAIKKDPKVLSLNWRIMKYIEHTFRPSETIDGVIQLLGRHNYTESEMTQLRAEFKKLNLNVTPRAGQKFKIPLLV